jgi:hypothetical protein
MSILKPKLCARLFHAWEHVKNMDNMICKCWDKTWFLKSFNEIFQLEVMELNVGTPLFSIFLILRPNNKKRKMTTLNQKIPCLKSSYNV